MYVVLVTDVLFLWSICGKYTILFVMCIWDGSSGDGMWVYGLDWAGPG